MHFRNLRSRAKLVIKSLESDKVLEYMRNDVPGRNLRRCLAFGVWALGLLLVTMFYKIFISVRKG
jgi:hypothetical protein